MKKILFLFSLLLCVQAYGQTSDTIVGSGDVNSAITWTLDSNNTLTISGEGDMPDYVTNNTPWEDYKSVIEKVVIKNGISRIGKQSFYNARNVKEVSIPNSVVEIGLGAFWGCDNLIEVNMPNSIKIIEDDAFHSCLNLEKVTMSDSVTSIGNNAFYVCQKLSKLNIPESVISIGLGALSTGVLQELTVNWKEPLEDHPYGFFGKMDVTSCILKVPAGTVSNYENAVVWQDFIIVELSGASDNADLSFLDVGSHTADNEYTSHKPTFSPDVTEYAVDVPYSSINAILVAFHEDNNAKVNGKAVGDTLQSDLSVGENIFTFIVTAEDGITQKTYTVVINRAAPSTNADLLGLNVSAPNGNNVELTPAFSPNATNYAASVP
ncbi:MAG: leucine-rich repeat protein, partial [Prevotellaceae bacterium]|nr:leucine-rich repeat protein [Prevotellaceae bacterium]